MSRLYDQEETRPVSREARTGNNELKDPRGLALDEISQKVYIADEDNSYRYEHENSLSYAPKRKIPLQNM